MDASARVFLAAMGRALDALRFKTLPVSAALRWAEKESGWKHDAVSRLDELGYYQVDRRSLAELGYTYGVARRMVRSPVGSATLSARHADALLRRARLLTNDARTAIFLAKLEHGLPILTAAVRREGAVSSPAEAVSRIAEADRSGRFGRWSGTYPRFVASAYYVTDGSDHGYAFRVGAKRSINRCSG